MSRPLRQASGVVSANASFPVIRGKRPLKLRLHELIEKSLRAALKPYASAMSSYDLALSSTFDVPSMREVSIWFISPEYAVKPIQRNLAEQRRVQRMLLIRHVLS